MALKSTLSSEEKAAETEEALDALDKLIDRLKVLYEQYFMGIQKQAPAHLHNDAERRIREIAQHQIRNTALRYRFATLQQKFGAYNTYWKRTLRDIEAGRYIRNLSKLRRQAQLTGETLPAEILAAMPKRMREAIERDRAVALADAQRKHLIAETDDAATEPGAPRVAAPTAPPRPRTKSITTDPFANVGEDDISHAALGRAQLAVGILDDRQDVGDRLGVAVIARIGGDMGAHGRAFAQVAVYPAYSIFGHDFTVSRHAGSSSPTVDACSGHRECRKVT